MVLAGHLVMSSHEPSESPFDELSSAYDAWFEGEGKPIFSIEAQAIGQLLPVLPSPRVEIGVGSGRFAQALGIGSGLDPSLKLLEIAQSRGVSTFLGKGERTPFADGCFGSVFLIVTLCFVNSPLAVLSEAYRVLKDNGKGLFPLPNSAQVGYVDIIIQRCPKDLFPLWGSYFFTIYSQRNVIHCCCSIGGKASGNSRIGEIFFTALYSGGQASTQVPHLTHFSWSIAFTPFTVV